MFFTSVSEGLLQVILGPPGKLTGLPNPFTDKLPFTVNLSVISKGEESQIPTFPVRFLLYIVDLSSTPILLGCAQSDVASGENFVQVRLFSAASRVSTSPFSQEGRFGIDVGAQIGHAPVVIPTRYCPVGHCKFAFIPLHIMFHNLLSRSSQVIVPLAMWFVVIA